MRASRTESVLINACARKGRQGFPPQAGQLNNESRRLKVALGNRTAQNLFMSTASQCALCGKHAVLIDSHLLPKALYRLIRDSGLPNPRFLKISLTFNKNREGWTLKHCFRGRGKFLLRDILRTATALKSDARGDLIPTVGLPGRAQPAALQATLVCRAVVCLVAMVPATGHALRMSHRELSRHGPPRLHENHAEVFVSDYSYRSATMGSTFAARRAGR